MTALGRLHSTRHVQNGMVSPEHREYSVLQQSIPRQYWWRSVAACLQVASVAAVLQDL